MSAGKYAEAVEQYTLAIFSLPAAVDYYIKRSTAYQRCSPANNKAALEDAEVAVVLALKRGKRELLTQAQLRRTIALFGLERYADAKYVLAIVQKLDEKEKSLAIWERKILTKLEGLAEDDAKAKLTVKDIPDVEAPSADVKKPSEKSSKAVDGPSESAVVSPPPKKAVMQTPADRIKHEWYQNNESVYITLLAKGVPRDQATIDIFAHSVSNLSAVRVKFGSDSFQLSISFPTSNSATYDLSFDPLFAEVDASKSTSSITPFKVEIILKKSISGVKWRSLEGDTSKISAELSSDAPKIPDAVLQGDTAARGPSYPTSSRSGPKDWDKVASGLGDEDDNQNVDSFFQKLYKDADPDTRRAMIKSYQESNGTSLSTNWSEVKRGPVETQPPDGMVAKKWGE